MTQQARTVYGLAQSFDRWRNRPIFHVVPAADADNEILFTNVTEAAIAARYLNQDVVTISERKKALRALKRAEGYNSSVYPDPTTIDTTIPEP